MTQRFLAGIGRASYSRAEDQLARDLIAAGEHEQVRSLHFLKVIVDARGVETDESWQREVAKTTASQAALL